MIGILLGILITQAESHVGRELIADGKRAAVTVQMLAEESAGIIGIFVEELGREQGIANDIPGNGVTNVVKSDEVGVNAELAFVAGGRESG